jgi:hypothetical protein
MKNNTNKRIRAPFRIEVKIKDEKGRKLYHFKEGQGNLITGMKVTECYVQESLGIPSRKLIDEENKRTQSKVKKIAEQGFGVSKECRI